MGLRNLGQRHLLPFCLRLQSSLSEGAQACDGRGAAVSRGRPRDIGQIQPFLVFP